MSTKEIEVKGLRELEKALLALQKEYGGKAGAQAMRPAVTAAIKPLKQQVIQDTPVDSGALQASIKQTVGAVTKDMLSHSRNHYNNTTVIAGRVGYFGNKVYKRAISVEYGTIEIAAQHNLENVFDREAKGMATRFGSKLGPAIEKKAKALHNKQMKG
jgi:hypothetical protein